MSQNESPLPDQLIHPAASPSWVIVVAAGSGSRFGSEIPKQYLALGDRRVLDHCLESFRRWFGQQVVLVVHADRCKDDEPGAGCVVTGGSTRSESVRCGLAMVPVTAEFVLVHDAARPLIDPKVMTDLLDAIVGGADGAIPGVPVTDTIKRVVNGFVVETPNRNELVAVQTPQVFRADILRRAHADGADATDDAALVEQYGGRIAVVPGSLMLRKVTTLADLEYLKDVLAAQEWVDVT